MHATLDTNVFGPLVSPADYPNHSAAADLGFLAQKIVDGKLAASIAESSLTLEALNREDRIDRFFREWANKTTNIALPTPPAVRVNIVQKAFAAGITVLHVSRVAVASFIPVPPNAWAADSRFSIEERQGRSSQFVHAFPDALNKLKQLGAELVTTHKIDLSRIPSLPGLPSPEEFEWLKGIVAEFDRPLKFSSTAKFANHVRDLVGEMSDTDMLGAHYGYGLDVVCTLDRARAAGSGAILHPTNRPHLISKYRIDIKSPAELAAVL